MAAHFVTNIRTDGRTDGRTHGRTHIQTHSDYNIYALCYSSRVKNEIECIIHSSRTADQWMQSKIATHIKKSTRTCSTETVEAVINRPVNIWEIEISTHYYTASTKNETRNANTQIFQLQDGFRHSRLLWMGNR
jgi:hypothetical protein